MVKKRDKDKLFVIRKYIKAHSAQEALNREKRIPVDDIWVDEDWKKNQLASAIGFDVSSNTE